MFSEDILCESLKKSSSEHFLKSYLGQISVDIEIQLLVTGIAIAIVAYMNCISKSVKIC
jgi:hypothetical protein